MNTEELYQLLPAIYRIRDGEQGEPLKALLGVIAEQVTILEENLAQLGDNQSIETCEEWVVPYIGDLIGATPLNVASLNLSSRSLVANTIASRRRKGTAAMLEQLARDVTGWDARVVEFFQLLITTQYLNHLRLNNYSTPDLRQWQPLLHINTAYDTIAHTVDVRRIPTSRGRYNIPNIGIFLWRLQAYPINRGTAHQLAPNQYTFNPLGLDAPLFNQPQTETEFTQLATKLNVPHPLQRRPLYEELEVNRQALVNSQTSKPAYFGTQPVLQIFLSEESEAVTLPEIPPAQILICDLSDWRTPPASKTYQSQNGEDAQSLPIKVAVDPVLGRITFPEGIQPNQLEVSYAYGFSHDVGGGSYDRTESVLSVLTQGLEVNWQRGVSQNAPDEDPQLVTNLTEAVLDWNEQPANTVGIITILDSRTYPEDLTAANSIQIPEGSLLLIVAADWPLVDIPDSPGQQQRLIGEVNPIGIRPHLQGNWEIIDNADIHSSNNPGSLIINGLLIEGNITVKAKNLESLKVAHSTIVPGNGGLVVESENNQLAVEIDHCITDGITLADSIPKLAIANSIINQPENTTLTAPGATTTILNSTIIGSSKFYSIEASNSIFTELVIATRKQIGCVRFSYLPLNSQVPRRYRTQPAKEEDATRVRPQFNSLRYGDPSYCQLSQRCAVEIRQGSDDEAEMGVFHNLYQPQRESNLRVTLKEYLRFGLEAGIFYET
ncbi:MAG: hypothetical protein AAF757_00175 [Cyanobacteria bacterium P01_D01_bin.116]